MNELQERLEALRRDLSGEIATDVATLAREVDDKGEDITPSQHPADVASDLYAREELVTEQLTLEHELAAVDDALARLREGTYGRCVDCGNAIAAERLEAIPHAARCIACQRLADRRKR